MYTSNGEIVPAQNHPRQKDAQEMINVLQLNNPDLVRGRKQVLQALTGLTETEAQGLWQLNSTKNQNGEFRSFCPTVLDALLKFFKISTDPDPSR